MGLPHIDLDLLHCFVSVVESRGFTQASKRLHLTQSAITQKTKRLEDLLGQRLFAKTTPPLELTHEGEIVMGYALRLLELNREMMMHVSRLDAVETVRLGVLPHFGYYRLPSWLATFKKANQQIRVVMATDTTEALLTSLDNDHFDLVIAGAGYTGMSRYKSGARLHEEHLQREELFWVQAENSKIDPRKGALPLVTFGQDCRFRPLSLDVLRKAGRTWEIAYEAESIPAILSAVEADLGLTVVTPAVLGGGIKVVGEKAGLPALPFADLALYYRKSVVAPGVQRLADFLIEQVADSDQKAVVSPDAAG